MNIIEVKEISDDLVAALSRLIPQLSESITPPSKTDLKEIVDSSVAHLFVAINDDQPSEIMGTVTLVVYRIPVGLKAWIEDMVVDERVRGQGIGTQLINAALERAAKLGLHRVHLTSAPLRVAANHLYQHLDFENITTNVYQKRIDKG